MIDWDEVNWGKGIAIIMAGLIAAGAVIFVLNDYLTFQRHEESLKGQIEELNHFYSTWKPPADADIAKIEKTRNQLEEKLAAAPFEVPESLEFGEIENFVREEAQRNGVQIKEVNFLMDTSRGFFKIQPVQVSFTGQQESVSNFLRRLDEARYAHQTETTRLNFEDVMNITIDFYMFDVESWGDFYKCKLAVTFPRIGDVNIEGVKIFKGDLAKLKREVDDKVASLAQAKKAVSRECEIEGEIGALEEKLGIVEELTSE